MTSFNSILNTKIDNNNSTTTLLTSNSVFTGNFTEVSSYNSIQVTINSDKNSAIFGIKIYFSNDKIDINSILYYSFTYNANENFIKKVDIHHKYYKLIYINYSENQTSFKLSSKLLLFNNLESNSTVSTDIFNNILTNSSKVLDYINFNKGIEPNNITMSTTSSLNNNNYNNNMLQASLTAPGRFYFYSNNISKFSSGNKIILYLSGILQHNGNGKLRFGYSYNIAISSGIYFEYNSSTGTISVGLNATNIPRSSWNNDKFDGNGISKLNIDFTTFNIFIIEYCSTGPIKFGLYINNKIYYCHIITNSLFRPILDNGIFKFGYYYSGDVTQVTIGSLLIIQSGYLYRSLVYNLNMLTSVVCNSTENILLQLTSINIPSYTQNINLKTINMVSSSMDVILISLSLISSTLTESTNILNTNFQALQSNNNILFSRAYGALPPLSPSAYNKVYKNSFISNLSIEYDYSIDIIYTLVISCRNLSGNSSYVYLSIEFEN